MDDLKPCPFCGGEAEHRSVTDVEGSVFYETGCGNESCCAWRAAQASTPQASISAWNARHEPCIVASAKRIKADESAKGRIDFNAMWNAMSDRSDAPLPARAAQVAQGEAVAKVRHFDYRGIARNGFSQEAQMLEGAPVLPDGTLLYTAPPAQPVERAAVTMHIGAPAAEPVAPGDPSYVVHWPRRAGRTTAERTALLVALMAYPSRNTHQLQARKVCEGVLAMAAELLMQQAKEASHG